MNKISELKLNKILISVKPTKNKKGEDDKLVDDKTIPNGWQLKTYEELEEINNKRINDNKFNVFWIKLNREYMVIDTDEEWAYNYIVDYLKENDLYNENAITDSYKCKMFNIKYKHHFWFKVNDLKQFKHIKQESQIKFYNEHYKEEEKEHGGEIFFGNNAFIGEFKDTIISNIPVMDVGIYNEIYEILTTKKPEPQLKSKEIEKVYIDSSDDEEDEKEEKEEKKEKEINKKTKITKTTKSILYDNEDIEEIKIILDGLDNKRSRDYSYWLIVYFIIINEKLPISLFTYFSKKTNDKYDEIKNMNILKNIQPRSGYTKATLYFWLKEDNPELYRELCKNRKDFWNLQINNISIADFYFQINPDKYIFTYENGWYEYDENNILIHRGEIPINLSNGMGRKLQEIATEQRNYITPENPRYKECMTFYKNFYNKVGTDTFIKSTINQLQQPYYQNIVEKINNVNLFAFNNILYDFNNNIYRKIEKNDYITLTTGYNLEYKIINNKIIPVKNDEYLKKIKNFIYSLFENDELVEYWFNITGSSLFGNDKQQKFYILTGKGSNGKSLTQKLLSNALGSYYKCVSNNLLTGSIRTGGANPELLACQGIRYLNVNEPDDTENKKFNVSNLKNWSGDDKIQARGLYGKKVIEFFPQFTININCNDKPELSDTDGGVKRRVRVVNFPFQFKEQKELKKNKDYRLININLKDEIIKPEFIHNFIILLIEHGQKNKDKLINTPNSVIEDSGKYVDENNPLYDWFNESLEKTENEKDVIQSTILFNSYNSSIHCKNKLRTNDFSKYMIKLGLEKTHNSKKQSIYTNIKFVEKSEDDL